MANLIKPKRSTVASKVPTTSDIVSGEIAINSTDQKIYTNNGSAVVQVGAGKLSALGEVVITTPSTDQVLKYDGTNWINGAAGGGDVVGPASATDNAIARYDGTTGKLIQNSTVTLDDNGNLVNVNAVGFDTTPTSPPTAAGSMFWDTGNGTPSVVLNANTTLQLGQENIALVYNGTGSTIPNGSVVAVSGAQGQRPSVVLADADSEPYSAATLGIATENIANGAEGFICTFGLVRGLDTSAFTDGQPIWLSQTAGQFTATKPPAPAHLVFLGWVVKVNASSGEVFVHISNGWELDELHNVLITSPTSGNTLIYDATAGVWKNANLTDGTGINITEGAGSITIANSGVTSLTGTANEIDVSASTGSVTLSLPATINADTTGTAANVTGTVAVANGGTGQTSYTNGQLLIGNTTGNTLTKATLTQGTGVTITNGAGSITVANSAPMVYPGAGIPVSTGTAWDTSKTSPTGDIVGTTDTQTLTNKTFRSVAGTVTAPAYSATSDTNTGLFFPLADTISFAVGSVEAARFTSAGDLGVGVVATEKLDVLGSIKARSGASRDAVVISGRAGGTSSFIATITPTTLTASRTITLPDATTTLVGTDATQTLTNKTLTDPAMIGTILEDVFTITDGVAFEIDPGNGSIQLITLGANRTPKATNFAAGEAITLMVDDGTAYTLTWTDTTFGPSGVIWETDSGVAPTLSTTGYTTIVLWKVASQVYGARVGNA